MLEAVEAPRDVATTNLWSFEVGDVIMATFQNVSGPTRGMGNVSATDGGTGQTYKFGDQKPDFGNITATRRRDPKDPNDNKIADFMDRALATGEKFNGRFVKYHHPGSIHHEIIFTGLLFTNEALPSFDKETSSPYDIAYTIEVDHWEEDGTVVF